MIDPYANRPLLQGHPDFEKKALETFLRQVQSRPDDRPRIERIMRYLERLSGPGKIKKVLVLGCGPEPVLIRNLQQMGYQVEGAEPVRSFVDNANKFLGTELVKVGSAEQIDARDESMDMVFFESVLEHVDSPQIALREIYRVLVPGGITMICTTNRHRISLVGYNAEFRIPFYNWFPPLLKECYVYDQLHFRPHLANYSTRPAVHWFTYSELCRLGREAGFAQFYSFIDLVRQDDPSVQGSLRKLIFRMIRTSPWLRALALTQVGDCVVMWKRAGF